MPNRAIYWLVVQQGICQEAVRRCEMPRCQDVKAQTKVGDRDDVRDGDDGHGDDDEDHGDDVDKL